MSLKLTILGCHSATPRSFAHPTSQHLEISNLHFLIDCGEGTQTQLRKYKIKFSKIKHIFISHLHGDHFFGLIGLISTFNLLNRKTELHIFGPKGIKSIVEIQLEFTKTFMGYPLVFHELESKSSELIFEDKKVEVHTIPLNHRVYTNGFLFKEKVKERSLDMNKIRQYPEIKICDYQNLKSGKNFKLEEGTTLLNKHLTNKPPTSYQYAYCSDTSYFEKIIPIIEKSDWLYHESTFLEDKVDLAKKTKHSTAKQAATIAKKANVKKLILGHYSSRYSDEALFLEEAKTIFENIELSIEGKVFQLTN